MRKTLLIVACGLVLGLGCGDDGGGGDDPDAAANGPDADPNAPDARPGANRPDGAPCVAADPPTECSDCIDNDSDGTIDGFDVQCISAADDDEGSFSTGIPGDNMDPNKQDCFFDGNSGAGDDGCDFDTCCLLQNCAAGEDCTITQECIDNCAGATTPGCDCFGCCTICDDIGCETVVINPAVAPNCTPENIHDPNLCPPCMVNTDCGTPCDPENCVLCPGQTIDDLPETCFEAECPDGQMACTSTADCGETSFCSNGCCIPQIQ